MFSLINQKINKVDLVKLLDFIQPYLVDLPIFIDSRLVVDGGIFCAYRGVNSDGNDYLTNIINKNIDIILTDRKHIGHSINTVHYYVKNLQQYVGIIADLKYNANRFSSNIIAVTGTNGKTSITNWLCQFYYSKQSKTALIGTIGCGIYGDSITQFNKTTPDPIYLQQILHDFSLNKVENICMEVSSHALDQGRVNGIIFKTAIFTNLTEDHLDYHLNMENYYQAKKQLFYWQGLCNIIINIDDQYGIRLHQELLVDNSSANIITYAINNNADLLAKDVNMTIDGTYFKLIYQATSYEVKTSLIGLFNVYNILALIGALLTDGYRLIDIISKLPLIKSVLGRMDSIKVANSPLIIIDYAHTPDALQNVLCTLKQLSNIDKLICVFGCGGDRDRQKRPIMGNIAYRLADYSIITSDNPRTENPIDIINQIVSGIDDENKYTVITNREDAILHAIKMASVNDVLLIAGKGHEQYQEINGTKYDFSDFLVVNKYLNLSE
jgi:UDP-N-acetylmuramoyl-L-alanyl-D-glutamate--2,6-diaminopimelate ligase